MCKVDIFPFMNPDGTQGQRREKTKCEAVRRNDKCPGREVFHHQMPAIHLPPSPMSTPRSGTPNYRSGDESGGSAGSHRRRSGVYIEVNGRRVYNGRPQRRPSHHHPERVVVVEAPPTPRTPPQVFTMPRTAPPSPSPLDSTRRGHPLYRPIIVDERTTTTAARPFVTINTTSIGHRRTSSNSSRHSRGSSASEEDNRRFDPFYINTTAQPPPTRRPTQAELDSLRAQRMAARIAAANAEINRRPAVPMPPTPPQRSSSTYVRPAVEVRSSLRPRRDPVAEAAEAARYADLDRRMQRQQQQEDEDEAQRQRLRERMTPQRRATVGGGSRRTRVVYPDGVYRWE